MSQPRTYQEIVEKYRWGSRLNALEELEFFARARSLREAILLVADARKENGALFSHQRTLEEETAAEVKRLLLAREKEISLAKDFEALITLVEGVIGGVRGVAEMYVYDAALRLGAFLRKMPDFVYLHKGTRLGAEALGLKVAGRRYLRVDQLPAAFHVLEPHEIEDVLCISRDDLRRVRLSEQRSEPASGR
jgi:hypothetical protein